MAKKKASKSERGRLLARARRGRSMNQTALAKKLNVDPSAVSSWESGKRKPNDGLTEKLAAALGLTTDQLLDILEKP